MWEGEDSRGRFGDLDLCFRPSSLAAEGSPLRGKAKGKAQPLCGQARARGPADTGGASHPKPGRLENSSLMSASKEGP